MRIAIRLLTVFAVPALLGWLLNLVSSTVYAAYHIPGYFGLSLDADTGGAAGLIVCLIVESVIVSGFSLKSLRWGCIAAGILFVFPGLLVALMSGLTIERENHRNFWSFFLIAFYSSAILILSAVLVDGVARLTGQGRPKGEAN